MRKPIPNGQVKRMVNVEYWYTQRDTKGAYGAELRSIFNTNMETA